MRIATRIRESRMTSFKSLNRIVLIRLMLSKRSLAIGCSRVAVHRSQFSSRERDEDLLQGAFLRMHREHLAVVHPAFEAAGILGIIEPDLVFLAVLEQHLRRSLAVAQLQFARLIKRCVSCDPATP